MMKTKSIKWQITLPKELSDKIEAELKDSYLTKSAWFITLVKKYFEEKEKKSKKIIELNI